MIFSLEVRSFLVIQLLNLYRRLLNCHNTDLPNWKGGGDISIEVMNRYKRCNNFNFNKIDQGDIIFQKTYHIRSNNDNPLKLKLFIENKAFKHLKEFF